MLARIYSFIRNRVLPKLNVVRATPPLPLQSTLPVKVYGEAATSSEPKPVVVPVQPAYVEAWASRRIATVAASASAAPPSWDVASKLIAAFTSVAASSSVSLRTAEFLLVNGILATCLPPINEMVLTGGLSREELLAAARSIPTVGAGCNGATRLLAHCALPDFTDASKARGPLSKLGGSIRRFREVAEDAGLELPRSALLEGFDMWAERVPARRAAAVAHAALDARAGSLRAAVLFLEIEAPGQEHYAATLVQAPRAAGAPASYRVVSASLRHYSMREWLLAAGNARGNPYAAAKWMGGAGAHAIVEDFFAPLGWGAGAGFTHDDWTPELAEAAQRLAVGARDMTPLAQLWSRPLRIFPSGDKAADASDAAANAVEEALDGVAPSAYWAAWVSAHDFDERRFDARLGALVTGLAEGKITPLLAV